jgi:hypothetical protein
MSREDVIAVAVRVFAIFLLVTVVRTIPGTLALIDQVEPKPSLVLVWLLSGLSLALCAYLWFFPLTVARKLLPAMREPRSETAMNGSVALSVGLTLLGVWVLTSALPDATYWVILFLLSRRIDAGPIEWQHDQIANMIATAGQLALAVWLIFGSSGIKRLILRFRNGPAEDVG